MVEDGEVVAYGSDQARTSFRVVKIEARRIIVEREGIKLEIPMKQRRCPGMTEPQPAVGKNRGDVYEQVHQDRRPFFGRGVRL